jgi:hypothetical protein
MVAGEGQAKIEDIAGVRSRISWQAVLAGAVTALTANLVFTMFCAAIGVSLTEAGVRANAVGTGALIAVLLSVIASLFIGGWVAAQLTAGETEREAILYGIMTWAAVVIMSVLLVGTGVRAGYFALVGGAMVVQTSPGVQSAPNWEQAARNAGVSQERIDAAKASIDPNKAREIANDPVAQRRAEEAAVAASWAALVGVLLSMASAIGGALVGRGPSFRLFPVGRVATVTTARRELIIP